MERTRNGRRRAQTRADLLAAARRVFAARGYHDAGIAEITAEAEVGVGTFYLHFRDKDELLTVFLQEGLGALRERIVAAVATQPDARPIPLALRTIFDFAYEERDLFTIALLGTGRVGPALSARADLAAYLTVVLAEAAANGRLPGYDAPLLARLLTGLVAQGILWWLEQADNPTPDPAGMTDQVLRLLREGLPGELVGA